MPIAIPASRRRLTTSGVSASVPLGGIETGKTLLTSRSNQLGEIGTSEPIASR